MNSTRGLIDLDEAVSKKRQRELYSNNLKLDQSKPIYEHSINLRNFIEGGDEYVFKQLVQNIKHQIPDLKIKEDLLLYQQSQQALSKLDGLNFLEDKEMEKSIESLKRAIKQTNQNYLKLRYVSEKKRMEKEHMSIQLDTYLDALEQLMGFTIDDDNGQVALNYRDHQLKQTRKLAKELRWIKDSFTNKLAELNKIIKSQLSQFETEYNTIAYQKKKLAEEKLELSKLQAINFQLQTEKSVISKKVRQLEFETKGMENTLEKQKKTIKQGTTSKKSHSLRGSLNRSAIQVNKVIYNRFVKQDNTRWFLFFLILATVLLIIMTMRGHRL